MLEYAALALLIIMVTFIIYLVTLALFKITVYRQGVDLPPLEEPRDLVTLLLGMAEYERRLGFVMLEQRQQGVVSLVFFDLVK